MNTFREAAVWVRRSALVLPVFAAFVTLMVIGAMLWIEDFSTSLAGYRAIPTRKVNDAAIVAAALLPQVGQVAFSYLFLSGNFNVRYKQYGLLLAFLCLFADVAADVLYKASGHGLLIWLVAIAESLTWYTFGSEISLAVGFGMTAELLPDVIAAVRSFLGRVSRVLFEQERERERE